MDDTNRIPERPYRYFVAYLADDQPRRRFLDLRYQILTEHNLEFLEGLLAKLDAQDRATRPPAVVILGFQLCETNSAPLETRVQLGSLKAADRAVLYDLLKAAQVPLALVQRFHAEALQPNLTAQELSTVVLTVLRARVKVQDLVSEAAAALPPVVELDLLPKGSREALLSLVETWRQDRVKAVQKCGEQLAAILEPQPADVAP